MGESITVDGLENTTDFHLETENGENVISGSLKGSYNNLFFDNLDETTATTKTGDASNINETNQIENFLENVYSNVLPTPTTTSPPSNTIDDGQLVDYKETQNDDKYNSSATHVYSNVNTPSPSNGPLYKEGKLDLNTNNNYSTMMSNDLDLDLDDPTQVDLSTSTHSNYSRNAKNSRTSNVNSGDNYGMPIDAMNGNSKTATVKIDTSPTNALKSTKIERDAKVLNHLHDTTMIDTALDLDSIN